MIFRTILFLSIMAYCIFTENVVDYLYGVKVVMMVIVKIDNSYASDLAVQFGYMKRKPNCSESFAYVKDGIVLASVVYGTTPSPTVSYICGKDESHNVYCINAIWIKPNVDRSVLTELLIESLKRIEKDIVVMYCSRMQVNVMRCLKEASFLYLGMTESQFDRSYESKQVNTLFGLMEVPNKKHNITAWYDKKNTIVSERERKHRFCHLRDFSLYDKLVYYEEDDYPV